MEISRGKQYHTTFLVRFWCIFFGLCFLASAPRAFADPAEDQFNFATGLFIDQEYDLAAKEYKAFLAKYAGHKLAAEALFQHGESLMRLERFKEAIPIFESYVRRPDTQKGKLAAAYFRQGKARAALGDHEKAAAHYQTFSQKFPKHEFGPAARYWVGECMSRAGKLPQARAAFEQALKQDKDGRYKPYSLYGLACVLQTLEKYDAAAQRFAEVVNKFAKEEFAPDAAVRLAQCYDSLGKFDDALSVYNTIGQEHGERLLVDSLMGRAWAFYHKGDLAQASALFLRIVKEHPKHPQADMAGFNAATALFNLGKYDAALPSFAALSEKKGEYALPAQYWKGMCLLKLDKSREALVPLQKVAGVKGEYQAGALFAWGDAAYQLGELDKARAAYETVASKFPKDELADDALEAAATAASELGANDKAIALAQRLIQQHPKSPLKGKARFLVGESLFRQEKFAQAGQAFTQLLNEKAQGVERDIVVYKLAWCASGQGNLKSASELFQRLVREHKDSKLAGESLYMAGKLLADQGRKKEARALYEQCRKSYAGQPAAESAAYAIALADFSAEEWKKSAAAFESFIKAHPKSTLLPHAWFYLAESRFAATDFDGARAAYDNVVQRHPKSELAPQAIYGSAWCLREKGDLQNASVMFEQAAAKFPKDTIAAETLHWAGRCRMDLAEWAKARGLLTRALAATGADGLKAEISYSVAHCLLREKNFDGAITACNAFLQGFAKSPRRENALYDLAWAYLGKEDEKRALGYFQQAAREAKDATLKADALFRLGEAQYAEKQYAKAAELYSQAAALEGVEFLDKIYYKLGWSQEKLGKHPAALAAYRKAFEQRPDGDIAADAALRGGLMLQVMGKHDEAAKGFQALVAKPGLDEKLAAKARFHQAESLRSLKRWPQAINIYRLLEQPNSGFEPPYHASFGLGVCAFELNALEDARRAFGRVVEQTDTETAAKAQMALGEILVRQKKYAGAAREFLKVHILYGYPEWKARGLLRAAQSFQQAGEKERAQRYLKQVIEKFPKSKPAAEARKLLGK